MIEYLFFFFKQKTAYEMRISDWSSDVCSSDLTQRREGEVLAGAPPRLGARDAIGVRGEELVPPAPRMLGDVADQRLQLGDQRGTPDGGEGGRDAHVLQLAIGIETEQE